MEKSVATFTFWLEDHWDGLLQSFLPVRLVRCSVNRDHIAVHRAELLKIPLDQIRSCERSVFSGPWDVLYTVHLHLVNGKGVALFPVCALEPRSALASAGEVDALIAVLSGFLTGTLSTLDPNPYYRALKRLGREAEIARREWNPHVSPLVYYREDHPEGSVKGVITGLLIMVLVLLAVFVLLGAIFGVLHVTF